MKDIKKKLKSLIPSKRKLIQLYSALLFNANIKGFFTGEIYKGSSKNICAPGLNCYSCPGAVGACPLGSLQNALGSQPHSAAFYVIGILLLYGLLLGRFICGFLCPFGLIQELLYKIKTPKLKKSKVTRLLSYLKYLILGYFVIIIPVFYILYSKFGNAVPGFCKYICPAGVIEGAFFLTPFTDKPYLSNLGPLFTWKFCLLMAIIIGSIFIFRFFCRFICPLGAIYGLFNHFAVFGIKLEKSKCTDCGLCISKCKVDIRHVNDHECINCGECIDVCPTQAISWKGSKFILPPNEIDNPIVINEDSADEEKQAAEAQKQSFLENNERITKRNKILKIVLGSAMALLLGFALIYFNFIDTPSSDGNNGGTLGSGTVNSNVSSSAPPDEGTDVGNTVQKQELLIFNESGLTDVTVDPTNYKSKIVIISFWTHDSNSAHLEHLNKIAGENEDTVVVIAIHTSNGFDGAVEYVLNNYQGSKIIFAKDYTSEEQENVCFTAYGGEADKPLTLVLDEASVIVSTTKTEVSYEELKATVDTEIENGDASAPPPPLPEVGNQVGNLCYSYPMEVFDENGLTGQTIDPVATGKITVINFWGTWCGGCIAELPYFDQIATEYKDSVSVIAVHTHSMFDTAADYVMEHYKDSVMIFAKDNPDPNDKYGYEVFFAALGGADSYPITIILDENGVIIATLLRATTYNELKGIIDGQLAK